jgi:hypothetical protein
VARSDDRGRGSERGPKDLARRGGKKKVCVLREAALEGAEVNEGADTDDDGVVARLVTAGAGGA